VRDRAEEVSGGDPRGPDLTGAILRALHDATRPPEVSGAGCSLIDGSGALRSVASTDAGARALSMAEELCHEGPGHEALGGYGVEVVDVQEERRWQRLGVLVNATMLRSVISLPILDGGAVVGAVFSYTSGRYETTPRAYDALRTAAVAVQRLLHASLADPEDDQDPLARELRTAVQHQPLLREAASHLIAGDADAGEGIAHLRRLSAVAGLTPVEVASRIVERGGPLPPHELTMHAAERRAHREELARLAMTDPLTGLPNRALFFDRLEQALQRSRRDGSPPAVLYVDLDRFKTVNDSLGHDAGDQVLLAVADRLRTSVRTHDTACRLGGDEFAVVCEGPNVGEEALRVGRRIARAVSAPLEIVTRDARTAPATYPVAVRASVGVAVAVPGQRATEVLRDADQAMYTAKGHGGDRVQLFSPEVQATMTRHRRLELSLRQLLSGTHGQLPSGLRQIHLVYQPIVALGTGAVVGLEALVRWPHPELGAVSAPELISAAELTGLIVPLGAALLTDACATAEPWARAGTRPGIELSVNVSALQVADPSFLAIVEQALERSGFPPEQLSLELTESRLLEATALAAETLHRLAALGIKLAIDDFGTGYSSLAYLSRLPIHRLKIDREFVAALGSRHGLTVAQGIIGLARALGLETVGEGIETAAQADQLRSLDCELAQGFLYSHPVPLGELHSALQAGTLAAH
jgi:diguanylate cyclase (GGDEF)-like protein